ncbi:MAG: FAD-dependent oxidoreductase [Bacilli bacterium]
MRIIIIGGVAAGTSAAAKARRNIDTAEIVLYDKDTHVSYSGCGLPYYIGGEIEEIDELTPRDAAFFKKKYEIDVRTGHEVTEIDRENKTLTVKNLNTNETFTDTYDKLVIATGASAFVPPIEGANLPHVFVLRNVNNAIQMRTFVDTNAPKKAVVVGSGFIGLEMVENLVNRGIDVTLVEVGQKLTPNLDGDMAKLLQGELTKRKVTVKLGAAVTKIELDHVELSSGETIATDLVLLATGVRPNVQLAKAIGLELGVTGAIKVTNQMQTNDPDIYACGDCVETFNSISGKPVYRPLGSTANKTGRIAGDAMTGGSLVYRGNLSTGIFQIFDMTVAATGLSEVEAKNEGYDVMVCHNIKPDKPHYFNGKEMTIKGIADRETGRLLGVQIIGPSGVDKRIDVFATLITYGANVEELFHLDLAYAPPFSTTKDPVHYTGMILENARSAGRPLMNPADLAERDDVQIVDSRSAKDYEKKGHVEGAVNIPHAEIRKRLEELDPEKPVVTYCNKGVTGNAAQNILIGRGFKEVYNLSGGHKFYDRTQKEGK